jgi:Leucine-rich repeat (LRR) protein
MPTIAFSGAVGFLDAIASSSDTEDHSPHSPRSRDRRQAYAKKRSLRSQYAVIDVIQKGGLFLMHGTTINLARCNLVSLHGLDSLPMATTILNLADNPLIVLDKNQFNQFTMRNLKVLSLRNTLLDELTPEQCRGLENLEELDISRNYIHPKPDPQALGLKNLKKFTYEPQLTAEEAKRLGY